MFSGVPGHFKAMTFWLLILTVSIVSLRTHSLSAAIGMLMLMLGVFICDQATHLAQPAHFEPAPTWIERALQRYRWSSVGVGIGFVIAGCLISF